MNERNSNRNNALFNWLGGIISGIVIATAAWWLVNSIDSPLQSKRSELKILNVPYRLTKEDSSIVNNIEIIVYNEGNTSADQCEIYDVSREGKESEGEEGHFGFAPVEVISKTFGVSPGDKQPVIIDLSSEYNSKVRQWHDLLLWVDCSNGISPYYSVVIETDT